MGQAEEGTGTTRSPFGLGDCPAGGVDCKRLSAHRCFMPTVVIYLWAIARHLLVPPSRPDELPRSRSRFRCEIPPTLQGRENVDVIVRSADFDGMALKVLQYTCHV
jgi:hypothetical protein